MTEKVQIMIALFVGIKLNGFLVSREQFIVACKTTKRMSASVSLSNETNVRKTQEKCI